MLNNIGLVEHCKKALAEGWGYVWGTYGKVLTESLLSAKLQQYPDNIRKYLDYIRKNYIGKRVVDCVGLIKAYIWWQNGDPVYTPESDKSANGMYQAAKIKGSIETMPELPGTLVWKDGHIGVYLGYGQVAEAKGTKYGVIKTPLKGLLATKWTNWCLCPYIDYVDEIEAYKAIILEHVNLDAPQLLWDVLDAHQYRYELYRKLADSYKR